MNDPELVHGYVLAGGDSSRFGRDKARAELHGRPLLDHVIRAISPALASVTVVARADGSYEDLGFRTLADDTPGLGPMGGLQRALADLDARGDSSWLLLCSCDLLGLRAAWVERLLAHRSPGRAAVAFRGERWEPLPALFSLAVTPVLEACVAGGQRALWRLLDQAAAAALPLPVRWREVVQVNTPAQLAACAGRRPA